MPGDPVPFATTLQQRLDRLLAGERRVKKDVAQRLIKDSVWWLTAANGPVLAPRHAERLSGEEDTWHLVLGANTLHVADLVRRFHRAMFAWAKERTQLPGARDWQLLADRLIDDARACVSNYNGGRFAQYPVTTQGTSLLMLFGATGIDLGGLLKSFGRLIDCPELGVHSRKIARTHRSMGIAAGPTSRCDWCGGPVLTKNLATHKEKRCSKRPGAPPVV
jgi:hypothetical protein